MRETTPSEGFLAPAMTKDVRHKRANTRAYEPQNDQETACRDACQVYWATGSVCHVFWRKCFALKSCTCPKGPQEWTLQLQVWLHAWLPAGQQVWLHLRGFGTRFGSFGGRLGSRFGRGLQPLWQAVYLRNIVGETQCPIGKNICQTPYTTSGLCPHNLSVGRTVTVFFNTTWETGDHYQQMSAMTH